MKDESEVCASGCGEIATERMRYFNGRYLNARDFRDEQRYHVSRRALHNRLLHGWGVVCGLRVVRHPRPECADRVVIVEPGIAVDCCGREVFVRQKHVFDLPKAEEWSENEGRGLFLCLRYCEELIECVPVLDPQGSCEGARKETSRVRESFKLEWQWLDDSQGQDCGWSHPRGRGDADDGRDDRDDDGDDDDGAEDADADRHAQHEEEDACEEWDGGRGCLEPRCPPNDCILLARLYRDDGKLCIDMTGRPQMPPPADYLTHICRINWPHGGTVTLSELRRMRRLRVTFDRPLRARQPGESRIAGPIGINACTFRVQFGGRSGSREPVEYRKGRPPRLRRNRREAVFPISPDGPHDERGPFHYLVGHIVFVTLFCDLIHDCRNFAVDGNHLGKLPSGDGVAGGTFYSWFEVIHDRDRDRERDHDHDDDDQHRTREERT